MSMWRNADKDGNGSIDFDEFVALLDLVSQLFLKDNAIFWPKSRWQVGSRS